MKNIIPNFRPVDINYLKTIGVNPDLQPAVNVIAKKFYGMVVTKKTDKNTGYTRDTTVLKRHDVVQGLTSELQLTPVIAETHLANLTSGTNPLFYMNGEKVTMNQDIWNIMFNK
jgi:hypothetical protein